jgi:DNA-binding NarL/FixJ family response regulator
LTGSLIGYIIENTRGDNMNNNNNNQKPRGHRKENVEVNMAIIALYICGFSKKAIARLLNRHKPNILKSIRKYQKKYEQVILDKIKKWGK